MEGNYSWLEKDHHERSPFLSHFWLEQEAMGNKKTEKRETGEECWMWKWQEISEDEKLIHTESFYIGL